MGPASGLFCAGREIFRTKQGRQSKDVRAEGKEVRVETHRVRLPYAFHVHKWGDLGEERGRDLASTLCLVF